MPGLASHCRADVALAPSDGAPKLRPPFAVRGGGWKGRGEGASASLSLPHAAAELRRSHPTTSELRRSHLTASEPELPRAVSSSPSPRAAHSTANPQRHRRPPRELLPSHAETAAAPSKTRSPSPAMARRPRASPLCGLVAALALAALASAHTVITYPGWRGNLITNETYPYGMQWIYPCKPTLPSPSGGPPSSTSSNPSLTPWLTACSLPPTRQAAAPS